MKQIVTVLLILSSLLVQAQTFEAVKAGEESRGAIHALHNAFLPKFRCSEVGKSICFPKKVGGSRTSECWKTWSANSCKNYTDKNMLELLSDNAKKEEKMLCQRNLVDISIIMSYGTNIDHEKLLTILSGDDLEKYKQCKSYFTYETLKKPRVDLYNKIESMVDNFISTHREEIRKKAEAMLEVSKSCNKSDVLNCQPVESSDLVKKRNYKIDITRNLGNSSETCNEFMQENYAYFKESGLRSGYQFGNETYPYYVCFKKFYEAVDITYAKIKKNVNTVAKDSAVTSDVSQVDKVAGPPVAIGSNVDRVLLPSSVFLDTDLIESEIPAVIQSIASSAEVCQKQDQGSIKKCETSKVEINTAIESLSRENCDQKTQGSVDASRDCVKYINNRISDGDGIRQDTYKEVVNIVLPEQSEIYDLLSLPNIKIGQNESVATTNVAKTSQASATSSTKQEAKPWVQRSLASGGGVQPLVYVSPEVPQGQEFLADIWNPQVVTDKFNKQDTSLIEGMRIHVKKQSEAYLDWCMKKSPGTSSSGDYSLAGMASFVLNCEQGITHAANICAATDSSKVMTGCENYVELRENSRNISSIQKILKDNQIIKDGHEEK